jgi:hypothetical protein
VYLPLVVRGVGQGVGLETSPNEEWETLPNE